MTKRIVFFFILMCNYLLCSGCSYQKAIKSEAWISTDKIKVLATTAMIGSVVKEIGKNHIDCKILIKDPLDPHSYELVKGDAEKISGADIIFYNGLGLEHGLSLRKNLVESERVIPLCNKVIEEHPEFLLFIAGSPDCHMWLDPFLWSHIIGPIVKALSAIDPLHEREYCEAGERYVSKLMALHEEIIEKFLAIPIERKYLVTGHDSFRYFVRRYFSVKGEHDWEERYMSPEGLAPEAHVGFQNVLRVIDYMQKFGVDVVFPESNLNDEVLKKITSFFKNKKNVRMAYKPLLADSMGGSADYIDMINHNVNVILTELTRNE